MHSPEAIMTAMRLFSRGAGDFVIDCQPEDRELLISDVPWTALDRSRVQRAIEALVCGALDASGIPRFTLPAEFLAGAIAVAVAPINVLVACAIACDRVPVRTAPIGASSSTEQDAEYLSPAQMSALVLLAKSRDKGFRSAFLARLDAVTESKLIGGDLAE